MKRTKIILFRIAHSVFFIYYPIFSNIKKPSFHEQKRRLCSSAMLFANLHTPRALIIIEINRLRLALKMLV